MLETTLKTPFVPGTNLVGELGCVDWRFLLPSFELDNLLCIGIPPANTLAVLSRLVPMTLVVSKHQNQLHQVCKQCKARGIANIHFIHADTIGRLPFANESIHLTLIARPQYSTRLWRKKRIVSELIKLLRPNGSLLLEVQSPLVPFAYRAFYKYLVRNGCVPPSSFWLTPFKGEFRTALPLKDSYLGRYFFKNVLFGQSLKKRLLSRIGYILCSLDLIGLVSPHRTVTVARSKIKKGSPQIPTYIQDIAQEADIDFNGWRFGLSARGKFNANKVIFYLIGKNAEGPEVVVKMTRAEEFNGRLENEYRVLQELCNHAYVNQGSFPKPLFFGYHKNLALLGLKAVKGNPFRTRTAGTLDCPIARNASDWICRLGEASADLNTTTAKDAAAVLYDLFAQFNDIYKLTKKEKTFLLDQITCIDQHQGNFPAVFQHGDPGTWNILVLENGEVVFIDWEAGELQGMPLWDLFYFFRTYASWTSRLKGRFDNLENFSRHFLAPSEIGSALIEKIDYYCSKIELDRNLIKPLFYTCWMHRALKESTRLAETELENGTYINLLRLCIKSQEATGLKSFFHLNHHGQPL